MTTNKKIILGTTTLIALGVGYYLLSPLWRSNTLNEPSPLTDSMQAGSVESLSAEDRLKFDKAMRETQDQVMMKNEAIPSTPDLVAKGSLMAEAHEAEGQALLIKTNSKTILRFENYKATNGPDLRIYLSADLEARDYIDLGAIKATEGNINYDVPSNTDTQKYKYALVWCRAFGVLFSYAELK